MESAILGLKRGGADLFSEMMMVKKTGITTELTNSYQSLRDGVEMLRQVMGDQWFYESRNQADTNAFLRKTLGEKFNATAVEQLINHATKSG
ncbi:MAG: hypothetical protein U0176_20760 [Bacteroidia bacterium]